MSTHKYESVFCTLQIEGIHNWPECPFEEVAYLRDPHRHIFHIKAYRAVEHSDRDVEFIMLKSAISKYIKNKYYDHKQSLCQFGAKSCEMLATELIDAFDLTQCEVSEDGENGSLVQI